MSEGKDHYIVGVFVNEHGMGTGHIPFLHNVITEVIAPSYDMTVSDVWRLIADDLEGLADYIRRSADSLEVVDEKPTEKVKKPDSVMVLDSFFKEKVVE